MQVLLDYLTFSSKIHDVAYFVDRLGLSGCEFIEGPGRNSYKNRLWYMGVNFYYGSEREDMNICVELSGSGCRLVEELSGGTFDWFAFLSEMIPDIRSREMGVSRIDIAGDDHEGILSFPRMYAHCKHRRYICRSRRRIWIDGDEQEILFGASGSNRRLRIYNKALEQGIEGQIEKPWVRVEMQMRNEDAVSFLLNWVKCNDIGRCYGGVLLDYLRFTDKAPDNSRNNHLLKTMSWWSKFVSEVQACPQLYLEDSPYTLQRVKDFLRRQASSSLKLWLEANGGDLSELIQMIDGAHLNIRQQQLLDKVRMECPYGGS